MATQTVEEVMDSFPAFIDMVDEEHRKTNEQLHTLQVNIGYRCNLACKHCHLQCSPSRTEMMEHDTLVACLDAYKTGAFTSLDVTGGAPEMHPELEWFLREAKGIGANIIVRSNLCILNDPEYAHFAQLYADIDATVFGSLPYYNARNVDRIRGNGTFMNSIEGIRALNKVGYGTGQHTLVFVFNPTGATLPPAQASLEVQYRRSLERDFGVYFTNLVAITNNPCGRFAERVNAKDKLGKYMQRLIDAFNPSTVSSMMCLDQISVDYAGKVYDCDFNQALGLENSTGKTIFDFAKEKPQPRDIVFANHCYGCTAGAGSSCGGETA